MAETRSIRVEDNGLMPIGQRIELWDADGLTIWVISHYADDPNAVWRLQTDDGNEAWPRTRLMVLKPADQ